MSDCRAVVVHKKIQELVASDFTSGFSGINLTNSVVRGALIEPPFTPYACVYFENNNIVPGSALARYTGSIDFRIFLFTSGSDFQDRSDAALNLGSDVVKKLVENRQLGIPNNQIDDIIVSLTAIDGDQFGFDQIAIAELRVQCPYQSDDAV